ncbi:hypothetical protein OF83DRAFT_1062377 [Amylostereum chailletii]|nr:hypothetical protein OF83DRAFT_1062377 [Amylostereum chailletii]
MEPPPTYYTLHLPDKYYTPSPDKSCTPSPEPPELAPEVLVDHALRRLASAGIELIEWGTSLFRRLNVPLIPKHFTYVVADDQFDTASDLLVNMCLPISPPHRILSKTEGDFHTKGRLYRLTPSTRPSSVRYLHLFPLSFPAFSPRELFLDDRSPYSLLAPRVSAIYASILRMMTAYPKSDPARGRLESDLEMLVHYNLMDLQKGYVDVDDDETWERFGMDRRLENAVATVQGWGLAGEWRTGEDWMEDALVAIIRGTGEIERLPWGAR